MRGKNERTIAVPERAPSHKAGSQLAESKSPYLLQHADNPVAWFPWGKKAFQKAKEEDKPVFLSIGYATCHWCHVMAHESFEDTEVADLLNRCFVSVKVDREERPDVDQVYMTVCQALTGRGGWPLSIFMTPDKKPFFAGTYFPKHSRAGMGMPGFMDICANIADVWKNNRSQLMESSDKITAAIQPAEQAHPGVLVDKDTLNQCFQHFEKAFDPQWGGFGSAPKFPSPHNYSFLLRWYARTGNKTAVKMVEKSLQSMRQGGIFDHIGLGFHRYSVDERWLVPHFEKMLYDQAMLSFAYTDLFQVTKKQYYAQVVREIAAYVLRDMTSPEGGFYSAEDADSEGEEGLFYVWKPQEIVAHLGPEEGDLFCRFYNITEKGNFEHNLSIPHMTESVGAFAARNAITTQELEQRLATCRKKLFHIREKRVHPFKDDKILSAWNGLMIAALSRASQALGEPSYRDAAKRSADFVLTAMREGDGRLYRRYRLGESAFSGVLEDYAFMVWGLIELYETTFEVQYLKEALDLNELMHTLFRDDAGGGFFFVGKDSEQMIVQSKDIYDGATPSGNSVAVMNLMRLARMTGDTALEQHAEKSMKAFSAQIMSHPMGFAQFLAACDFIIGPAQEIVVVGNPGDKVTEQMLQAVKQAYLPNKVLLFRGKEDSYKDLDKIAPYAGKMASAVSDRPTAFWCQQFACQEPITAIEKLESVIMSA
jgi:uncharacterized protein